MLEKISFEVAAGEVCCVLGPNGVGKTTLFKTVLGVLDPLGGKVLVDGRDVADMPRRELAGRAGYVPQAHTPPFPFTVLDVVEMGRAARVPTFSAPGPRDRERALEALNALGIAHLHDRLYTQVSGGERQLVMIARALAQEAGLLVMDEPAASLDFGNQARLIGRIRQLARSGYSVVMATHSPDHALLCADTVVAILDSERFAAGPAESTITEELLCELYGVGVRIGAVDAGAREVRVAVPVQT